MITIDLTGRNALITGGTRGIGRAISHRLAEAGASTAAVYRADEPAARQSLVERQALDLGTHHNYQADLADPAQIGTLTERVLADFGGRLDLLILNSAAGAGGKVTDIDPAEWQRALDVNLTANFLLTRALVPHMPRGGSIVAIASGAGHDPIPGLAGYGATKAGLILFMQDLAQDVGPDGIRANVVSPGATDTGFGLRPATEQDRPRANPNAALRRVGVPDDVARVVLFLCSDLAAFVTGQALRVNGGIV